MVFCRCVQSCLACRTSGLPHSWAIRPFLICVLRAAQKRVNTARRTPHSMGCQESPLQFHQGDVRVMLNQFHKKQKNRASSLLPLRGPEGNRSSDAPSRTFMQPSAAPLCACLIGWWTGPCARRSSHWRASRGSNLWTLTVAAAQTPTPITFLNRTRRRSIESPFPPTHPPTQEEPQINNSGKHKSIHNDLKTGSVFDLAALGRPSRASDCVAREL